MLLQPPLPELYHGLSHAQLAERIADCKKKLGSSLCILGHHYQNDEVIAFADLIGDSLRLSQLAARQTQAKYIVFCGVHFMAESADILSGPEQIVCLPNLYAGCAMAEMADDDAVANAFDELASLTDERIVPITYVNSTAAIKALTGRHGGACCTSSNVRNVFQWALTPSNAGGAAADKIFALPDEHLARNTAVAMGYELDDCVLYDPSLPNGGITREQINKAKFILWKGHCYVHQQFTPQHVLNVRKRHPGITVIVHPECPREVVELADLTGSTEQIIRTVSDAPPETRWAIGTEANLVHRLAKRFPDRFIRLLSDTGAICAQMARIDLPHLAWVLDSLVEGHPLNQVHVDEQTASAARLALQRMIDIKAVSQVTEPRR